MDGQRVECPAEMDDSPQWTTSKIALLWLLIVGMTWIALEAIGWIDSRAIWQVVSDPAFVLRQIDRHTEPVFMWLGGFAFFSVVLWWVLKRGSR